MIDASRLGPAGGAGAAVAPAGGGVAGACGRGGLRHRGQPAVEVEPVGGELASIASAGFKVSVSEPPALSWPSASLKSLIEIAVCEASTAPSKVNLPASSGGRSGCGWPVILISVSAKPIRLSDELEAMPVSRALGPSSLSLPSKPSLPPASRARSTAWPSAALAPTDRSSLSGAPLMVAEPAIEYGPSSERTEALKLAFSATIERPALESLKISVPLSMVRRPSDSGLGESGLGRRAWPRRPRA